MGDFSTERNLTSHDLSTVLDSLFSGSGSRSSNDSTWLSHTGPTTNQEQREDSSGTAEHGETKPVEGSSSLMRAIEDLRRGAPFESQVEQTAVHMQDLIVPGSVNACVDAVCLVDAIIF